MVRFVSLFLCWTMTTLPASGQAKARGSEAFQSLVDEAVQAHRAGQAEQAIRLYLKALQLQPDWADGWHNVGMLLADRREFARAEAAFRNVLDIQPRNGSAWALLGLCEYEQGRLDEAFAHIQQGRALGVRDVDLDRVATYHAALIAIRKGEFEMAHNLLVRVARSGVEDPDLVTAFGLASLRLNVSPGQLGEEQRELVERLGRIAYSATRAPVPDVIAAYEKLLAEKTRTPGLHYAFGNYLASVAHYDRALEEMLKELALVPNDVMALLQVAMTHLRLNRPGQALPYAERAVALAPTLFACRYALGWALHKVGRNREAVSELERAVKLEPNSPQTHYALSQAYLRLGRKTEAAREREEFARLSRKAPPAEGSAGGREYSGGTADVPGGPLQR